MTYQDIHQAIQKQAALNKRAAFKEELRAYMNKSAASWMDNAVGKAKQVGSTIADAGATAVDKAGRIVGAITDKAVSKFNDVTGITERDQRIQQLGQDVQDRDQRIQQMDQDLQQKNQRLQQLRQEMKQRLAADQAHGQVTNDALHRGLGVVDKVMAPFDALTGNRYRGNANTYGAIANGVRGK